MFFVLNPPYGPPATGGAIALVCAVVKFPEEDQGSDEVGKASSEEVNGADEEGNGSAAVEGNGSGAEGSGGASIDDAGSLEGSVGSDHGGRATSSTDSCACVVRTIAKKIAAITADVLPAITWAMLSAVVAAERVEDGAKRRMYRASPGRIAASLEVRY